MTKVVCNNKQNNQYYWITIQIKSAPKCRDTIDSGQKYIVPALLYGVFEFRPKHGRCEAIQHSFRDSETKTDCKSFSPVLFLHLSTQLLQLFLSFWSSKHFWHTQYSILLSFSKRSFSRKTTLPCFLSFTTLDTVLHHTQSVSPCLSLLLTSTSNKSIHTFLISLFIAIFLLFSRNMWPCFPHTHPPSLAHIPEQQQGERPKRPWQHRLGNTHKHTHTHTHTCFQELQELKKPKDSQTLTVSFHLNHVTSQRRV